MVFFGHRHTGPNSNNRQAIAGAVKLYKDGET